MTQINLLPWREHLKQEMYIRYGVNLTLHLFIIFLIVIFINVAIYMKMSVQNSRNNYLRLQLGFENELLIKLKKDTAKLEKTTTELNNLLTLKGTSYQAVRQLDELARVMPNNIFLKKIVREGSLITVTGIAKSNLDVPQLMKNINNSSIFYKPDLTEISTADDKSADAKQFVLKIQTKSMVKK